MLAPIPLLLVKKIKFQKIGKYIRKIYYRKKMNILNSKNINRNQGQKALNNLILKDI